jgi:hypothetical protein
MLLRRGLGCFACTVIAIRLQWGRECLQDVCSSRSYGECEPPIGGFPGVEVAGRGALACRRGGWGGGVPLPDACLYRDVPIGVGHVAAGRLRFDAVARFLRATARPICRQLVVSPPTRGR